MAVVIIGMISKSHLWLNFHFFTNIISWKVFRLEGVSVVKCCDQEQHDA
jgi:hypothetical protein